MTILEKIGRGVAVVICILASLAIFSFVFLIAVWTGADSTPSPRVALHSGLMLAGGVLAGVSLLFGALRIGAGRDGASIFRRMVIVHFGLVGLVLVFPIFSILFDDASSSERAEAGILVVLGLPYLLAAWGIFAWRHWGQLLGIVLFCLMGVVGIVVSSGTSQLSHASSPILELVPLYLVLILDLGWLLSAETKRKFASDGMRA